MTSPTPFRPAWPVRLVIFDLDGTLIDSVEDIAHSVNELRRRFSLDELPRAQIAGYVGHGVRTLLERSLSDAPVIKLERDLEEAVDTYLSIYRVRLLDHTRPYPGVEAGLEALDVPGRSLCVLTNKPQRESVTILEGLGLLHRFDAVYGGDSFPRRKPDPVGVNHLLEKTRASAGETVFVGDTGVDLETARNASVPCCLVTYGIRPERLHHLEPDFRIADLRELASIVGAPA